ncbi:MAG: amino acid permease, partial [Acidimicrobiia bacterium]|nr:amino acid permease [Acidimicrobiia bacterium]
MTDRDDYRAFSPSASEPSRLARRLGLTDAVMLGLGSMIGAGVFVAVGPAAAAAGSGLLLGLAIAGAVAYANATSSAQLAAAYPEAGGTYVYGRERLGPFWGYLAGWGFVVGKSASLAAMALTAGAYLFPGNARVIGVTAVVTMTAVNYSGIEKTARLTKIIVVTVLIVLAVVVVATLSGDLAPANLDNLIGRGIGGILEAAGLLFFAFAGYARIATLGEEVADPSRTIPRAIPLALGITLIVYAAVMVSALLAVGPDPLAGSSAPLAEAAAGVGLPAVTALVRTGGGVATLGVMLSLLAGISRTIFAMAHNGELPGWLGRVHSTFRTPHWAQLAVGALVAVVVAVADLRGAIGFSSFAVLVYYGIANASAYTQPTE